MGLYLVANCLHHAHPLYFWRILSVRHHHWFQVPPQFLHQSVGEQNDQIHCHKSTDKQSQVGVFQSLEWQEQLLWLYVPTQLCLYVPTMYQPDILWLYVLTPPPPSPTSVLRALQLTWLNCSLLHPQGSKEEVDMIVLAPLAQYLNLFCWLFITFPAHLACYWSLLRILKLISSIWTSVRIKDMFKVKYRKQSLGLNPW